jgi:hypothetical protein
MGTQTSNICHIWKFRMNNLHASLKLICKFCGHKGEFLQDMEIIRDAVRRTITVVEDTYFHSSESSTRGFLFYKPISVI